MLKSWMFWWMSPNWQPTICPKEMDCEISTRPCWILSLSNPLIYIFKYEFDAKVGKAYFFRTAGSYLVRAAKSQLVGQMNRWKVYFEIPWNSPKVWCLIGRAGKLSQKCFLRPQDIKQCNHILVAPKYENPSWREFSPLVQQTNWCIYFLIHSLQLTVHTWK